MSATTRTLQGIASREEAERIGRIVFDRIEADEALLEITGEEIARAAVSHSELGHLEGEAGVIAALQVSIGGRRARVQSHDVSDEGLAALVEEAQTMARSRAAVEGGGQALLPEAGDIAEPDGLYVPAAEEALSPQAQGAFVDEVARRCREAGVVASGLLVNERHVHFIQSSSGYGGYIRSSYGEFSLNARTRSGTGAGWAWAGGEDPARTDAADIASRAIDLARRSENPVAVEPGRYTVILEPEAVAQLVDLTVRWTTMFLRMQAAEERGNVFSAGRGSTRIGEQMTDPRVQLYYDPYDAILPFSPLHEEAPLARTHWLRDGVLENLSLDPGAARERGQAVVVNPMIGKLEVSGPTQTLDEMIAGTARGIWVHHFGSLGMVDWETQLLTGMTRDGTFLIERGEVTRPVSNLRFLESIFFILNKLDVVGAPVRAHRMIAAPRLRVHDFEFNSLSTAI